ncbi:MAG: hypothetical protein V4723_02990 [Pseudomonadota bacterium]
MHKILAVVTALASLSAQAAPMPLRSDIFTPALNVRPAISSSGRWIASSTLSDGKLRLFPMDGGGPVDPGLPADARMQYYRWANAPHDALIMSAARGQRSDIYRFDLPSGTLTRVTGQGDELSMAFNRPINNYAFGYDRYRNGSVRKDLAPNGELVAVQESGNSKPILARQPRCGKHPD